MFYYRRGLVSPRLYEISGLIKNWNVPFPQSAYFWAIFIATHATICGLPDGLAHITQLCLLHITINNSQGQLS